MDKKEFEKMLAEVDDVALDDMPDVVHGGFVDSERWERYQNMVKALFAAQDKSDGKIVKIEYLQYPDPLAEYVGAMVILPKVFWFSGDGKAALLAAAGMADRLAVTMLESGIRASFTIDRIWKDEGGSTNE